jgi:hypothetical protein
MEAAATWRRQRATSYARNPVSFALGAGAIGERDQVSSSLLSAMERERTASRWSRSACLTASSGASVSSADPAVLGGRFVRVGQAHANGLTQSVDMCPQRLGQLHDEGVVATTSMSAMTSWCRSWTGEDGNERVPASGGLVQSGGSTMARVSTIWPICSALNVVDRLGHPLGDEVAGERYNSGQGQTSHQDLSDVGAEQPGHGYGSGVRGRKVGTVSIAAHIGRVYMSSGFSAA